MVSPISMLRVPLERVDELVRLVSEWLSVAHRTSSTLSVSRARSMNCA